MSAAYNNNLENWIQQVEGDINSVTLSGGSSGTAHLYQILQGTIKIALVQLNNFKTGGSTQQITLPVTYTYGAMFIATDVELMSVKSGGADQPLSIVTGLPSPPGAGGHNSSTTFNGWQWGDLHSGFNQVNFGASWGAAHGGFILIVGI